MLLCDHAAYFDALYSHPSDSLSRSGTEKTLLVVTINNLIQSKVEIVTLATRCISHVDFQDVQHDAFSIAFAFSLTTINEIKTRQCDCSVYQISRFFCSHKKGRKKEKEKKKKKNKDLF